MLCIDFVLFLKDQILREFQNVEIFVIFSAECTIGMVWGAACTKALRC